MTNYKSILSFLLIGFVLFSCKNESNKEKQELEKTETSSLSREALLDTVQKQTLKYFWDYAEPNSGMARERYHPDGEYPKNDSHVVTTGGSGLGLMAIVSGMEREWIERDSAVARLDKIADFLDNAPRFHGVWPHWLNGETGEVQAFSDKDNGAEIIQMAEKDLGEIIKANIINKLNEYFRKKLNISDILL